MLTTNFCIDLEGVAARRGLERAVWLARLGAMIEGQLLGWLLRGEAQRIF